MPSTLRVAACGLMLATLLSGCEAKEAVEAPFTKLTCYHMAHNKAGGYDFNVVAKNIPNLEYCAAALERMRLRFVSLGGTHTEITGSYQGQFIFVQREGGVLVAEIQERGLPRPHTHRRRPPCGAGRPPGALRPTMTWAR